MSRFTSHLGLVLYEDADGRPVLRDGRSQWFLSEPLGYDVGAEGSGESIVVPATDFEHMTPLQITAALLAGTAFLTDLASIPRLVSGMLPPDGPWAKAAVVHDYLYVTRGIGGRYDRKRADDILKEAMAVLGVPAWKRQVIWMAVRVGGAGGWGR